MSSMPLTRQQQQPQPQTRTDAEKDRKLALIVLRALAMVAHGIAERYGIRIRPLGVLEQQD